MRSETTRRPRAWRPHGPAWLLLLALAGAPAAAPLAQSPAGPALPSLGDSSGMSVADERRLGDSIARGIYRDPDYLDDPVLGDYLQALWQPLLGSARARGDIPPELSDRLAWELMISRDKRVNAFALPGGYMGVQLGLLAVTATPAELASVLAHELSHVSQRHIARLVSRQSQQAPWLLGAMILGALAAGANAEVANAAIIGGQAVAAQNQLNFSRDMEREADRVGFGVMTGAGFEGEGFVAMFEKLQQASRLNDDGSFPYLRTHPLNTERMADMRSRLPLAGSGAARGPLRSAATDLPSTEWHVLMAARARVLGERSPDRWRDWLRLAQGPRATPADLYAGALAARQLREHTQALALMTRLRGVATGVPGPVIDDLELELRWAAASGGALPATDARLLALRDTALASQQRADLLLGAQAALLTGAALPAAERLQAWVVQHPRDALAWQTLSVAHLALGRRLRAIRAEAEARVAQLDHAGALERLKAAQALPAAERGADPFELAIVDARRRDVEALLRESARED